MTFYANCFKTICIKCQSLFSGKIKTNISLSSADFGQRLVDDKKNKNNVTETEDSTSRKNELQPFSNSGQEYLFSERTWKYIK